MAILYFCSRLCIFLTQRQLFLRPSFCPTALLPSPRPCRMLPFGPLTTSGLCSDPFPTTSLCQQSFVCLYVHGPPPTPRALSFPSRRLPRLSSCPTAPSQLCSPLCVSLTQTEPFLSLALCPGALLPYSLPSGMSPLSRSSPEDIWTLFRSLPDYLIVSAILCLSLCPRSPLPPGAPLVPITTPPETVLVPHGTLPALQPSLYLSYSDRTLPQACSVPQSSFTLFTAI